MCFLSENSPTGSYWNVIRHDGHVISNVWGPTKTEAMAKVPGATDAESIL